MGVTESIGARFRLQVRCDGCRKITTHILDAPDHEDAPREVDELLASAFLQRQRFECRHCDGCIGRIIGATQVHL